MTPPTKSKRAKRRLYKCARAQCGAHFIVDKRVMVCAVCAYEAQLDNPPKSEVDTLRAQLAEREAEIAEQQIELAEAWKQADYWEIKDFEARNTIARQSAALAGAREALGHFVAFYDRSKSKIVADDFHQARAAVRAIDEAIK